MIGQSWVGKGRVGSGREGKYLCLRQYGRHVVVIVRWLL